jgi:hypothetical protein
MAYDTSQPLDYYEAPNWRLQPLAPVIGDIGRMAQQRAAQRKENEHQEKMAALKKPSYRIDNAKAPFRKDAEKIGGIMDRAIGKVYAGQDPFEENQLAAQVSNESVAHQTAINEMEQSMAKNAQKWGKAYDPSQFDKNKAKALNEDDHTTRGATLDELGGIASDPSRFVNGEAMVRQIHDERKETPVSYKSTKENGSATNTNDFTIHAKYLTDTNEPILDASGNQVQVEGQKQFKKRPVRSAVETLPFADEILVDSEKRYVLEKQYSDRNNKTIDEQAKQWAQKQETYPSPEEIDSYKTGLVQSGARNKLSEDLFKMEKARMDATTSRTLDEPREANKGDLSTYKPQAASATDTSVLYRMHDGKLNKASYKTATRPFKFTDPQGNDLKISASNFDGINEETGKRFATTQSMQGTLSSIVPAFGVRETTNGKTETNSHDIREETRGSYYDNILKDFSEAKIEKILKRNPDAKIGFYPKATATIEKRKKDYSELGNDPNKIRDVERLKELMAIPSADRDEDQVAEIGKLATKYEAYTDQNISTDANNIAQLRQKSKNGNVMDLALSQATPQQREQIRKTQEAIDQRVATVRKKMSQPAAQKKTAPHGNKVSQGGVTYVWNGTEYQPE